MFRFKVRLCRVEGVFKKVQESTREYTPIDGPVHTLPVPNKAITVIERVQRRASFLPWPRPTVKMREASVAMSKTTSTYQSENDSFPSVLGPVHITGQDMVSYPIRKDSVHADVLVTDGQ